MANTYDIGDMVRMTFKFSTAAGVPIDPSTMTVRLRVNAAAAVIYTYSVDVAVVKDSVGEYHLDYITLASGSHRYEGNGTGAATASEPGYFAVRVNAINAVT